MGGVGNAVHLMDYSKCFKYIYMYGCIYIYIYGYVHIYIYTCIYIYIYMYVYIYIYIYIYTHNPNDSICIPFFLLLQLVCLNLSPLVAWIMRFSLTLNVSICNIT